MGLKPELTSKSLLGLDYETFMQGARKVLPTYVPKVPETPYKNDPYTAQIRQLQDANQFRDPTNGRWNVRNQTGFDDERDNQIDDRALRQQSYANYQEKNGDSDMSDYKNSGKTVINSSRPSDYAPGEKANLDRFKIQLDAMNQRHGIDATTGANLQNYQWQSQDRQLGIKLNAGNQRYKTDVDASVNREIGLANVGVTREVGLAKTYADLKANLNRNQLQSDDNRFETTTKYGTQERINAYNRNTVDRTAMLEAAIKASSVADTSAAEITKAKIQAGIYGLSDTDVKNMSYGRYQMEIQKFNDQRAMTERSYSDQRSDLENARRAAESRFNIERNDRIANLEYDRQQRKIDRDRSYYEFDIRRNDTNATLAQQNAFRQQELAFRQQEINNSSALDQARIAQIYADTKLKNDQFGAGRADISYNRNIQRSRSIAF